MAAVRGLYLPTEEQHCLRAGVWPGQDPLFVYTAQDLQGREVGCRMVLGISPVCPGATYRPTDNQSHPDCGPGVANALP